MDDSSIYFKAVVIDTTKIQLFKQITTLGRNPYPIKGCN